MTSCAKVWQPMLWRRRSPQWLRSVGNSTPRIWRYAASATTPMTRLRPTISASICWPPKTPPAWSPVSPRIWRGELSVEGHAISLSSEDTAFLRRDHGAGPVLDSKFFENTEGIGLDRALRDRERGRDLFVRSSLRHELENLRFARGQRSAARGSNGQTRADFRRDMRPSRVYFAKGLEE